MKVIFAIRSRRQHGVATILLVLFIGLALMATVYSVVHVAQNAQSRTLAVHAVTPAQGAAWAGVEGVRRYLHKERPETIRAWEAAAAPVTLAVGGEGAAGLEAVRVTHVENIGASGPDTEDYRVTVELQGKAGVGAVQSAAPVEIVYELTLRTAGAGPVAPLDEINAADDLEISGNTSVTGAEHANVGVTGNVDIHSTNLTGIDTISATGYIKVDSGVNLEKVHANGDVELIQGTKSTQVLSRGKVLLSGHGGHGEVQAHGTVTLVAASADLVKTQRDLVTGIDGESCGSIWGRDGTYVGQANVEGDVWWYSCGGGLKTLYGNGALRYHGASEDDEKISFLDSQHLRTIGAMDVRSAQHVGRFTTKGSLTHTTTANPSVGIGGPHAHNGSNEPSARHEAGYCVLGHLSWPLNHWHAYTVKGWASTFSSNQNANAPAFDIDVGGVAPAGCDFTFGEVEVPDVPEYTRSTPKVDARALKDKANLVFERDPVFGKRGIKVTVRSMNGVADGTYALGHKMVEWNGRPDQLCKVEDLSKTDPLNTGPNDQSELCSNPVQSICLHGANVSCITFHEATEEARCKWVIGSYDTKSMARGVVYFEDCDVELNVSAYVNTFITPGDITTAYYHSNEAPNYAGYDKLCKNGSLSDRDGGEVKDFAEELKDFYPTNLCEGGSVSEDNAIGNVAMIAGGFDESDLFSGGNISVKGVIGGTVMAGNELSTSGAASINGYVLGAAQGDPSSDTAKSVDFNETTEIDLSKHPGWNPAKPPCMSKGCNDNSARVRWARYR